MKKAPEAFRTISEVSDLLDTPAHVLRFWESKFYQIRPVKRAGGRRYYRPDDVALLGGIRLLLQDQGMTIRGVQKVLQEQGVRHVASLAPDLVMSDDDGESIEGEAIADHVDDTAMRNADAPHDRDVAANTPQAPLPRPAAPRAPKLPVTPDETLDTGIETPTPAPVRADAETDAAASDPAPAPPPEPTEPTAPATAPPDAVQTPRTSPPRAAIPPVPDLSDRALALDNAAETERLAQALRRAPRDSLAAHKDQVALLARRIDALLDRMSDASGAGRW